MWWGIGDDGVFRLHLDCDPVTGMIIDAALHEARDALFQHGHTDVTDVDAMLEMAQRSLDTVDSPARRDRFRTNIHIDTHGNATDARGWTPPRRHPPVHHLRRAALTGVHRRDDPHLRRTHPTHDPATHPPIVLLRDQGCRIPGCNETHHLEVHHIIHWEDDGTTDTWNLIALCPRHHRMHHRGELGITGNADLTDGVTFTNRHGRLIGTTGARPQPPGAPPPTPTGVYEHPLGERLDPRWLYFNPPPEHRTTAWANHPTNPHRTN